MGGGSGGVGVITFAFLARMGHTTLHNSSLGLRAYCTCTLNDSSLDMHAYYTVCSTILLVTCTHTTKYVTLFFSVLALQNTLRYSSRDLHSCYTLRDMFPLVTYSLVRGNVDVTEHVRHESCNRAGTNSSK